MNKVLNGIQDKYAIAYLDDIIVHVHLCVKFLE